MATTTIRASSLVEQFHTLQFRNNQLHSVLHGNEKRRFDEHLAQLAVLYQVAGPFLF
jgi:hypothetical protein